MALEKNQIKDLTYDEIYNRAINIFKTNRATINLHQAAIKSTGLKDTKSIYILAYMNYLNGEPVIYCLNMIKDFVKKEIVNQVNIPLKDIYSVDKMPLFEVYDNIPFDGINYSFLKLLYEGYSYVEICRLLNLDKQQLKKIKSNIIDYVLANDYCARTKHLLDLIKIRYDIKFTDKV